MKQPRKIVQISSCRGTTYSELYALDEDGVAWRYHGTKDRPWDRLSALPEKDVPDPVVMTDAEVEPVPEPPHDPPEVPIATHEQQLYDWAGGP